jgi:hypothetical protein
MDFIPDSPENQKIAKIDFTRVDLDAASGDALRPDSHPNVAILHCS